jgi:transposase
MRYELADYEWIAIKPMLPNKPRGVPRVNDRRVLNGIFWVLRSGAPWRDLPEMFGPYTTCYNRFVRWRRAGVWGRIIDALAAAHDAAVQMIDTSIVRVHQHGACITRNRRQSMGRSRGGLTSKIHAVVDSNGLPVRLALSPGAQVPRAQAQRCRGAAPAPSGPVACLAVKPVGKPDAGNRMGNGAMSRGPSHRADPRLYRASNSAVDIRP